MTNPTPSPDIQQVLGLHKPRQQMRKRIVSAFALLLLAAGIAWLVLRPTQDASAMNYVTAPAENGNLVVTVSATGNLQPTNQVDVGSELSGTIQTVLVNENDRVSKGQILAWLDPSRLKDQVALSRAALASAEAQVLQAVATEDEARANLSRLREVARLSGGKVPSKAELDNAEAALARARANVAASRAAVEQARATLNSNETNLAKSVIRSPIDGVVLSRQVEPGQTVAASFQAPVLFTMAEDLARMELQVDVDEADVGEVREGQQARFSVDAYRNRTYPAAVVRVNYGSQVKDGVVSYLTILQVDNDDLSLRPGMTATAEITTTSLESVLLVSNAALRFSPASAPAATQRSLVSLLLPRPPRSTSSRNTGNASRSGKQQVWVLRNSEPVPIEVTTGATDGRMTQITGGGLQPGMEVITEALAMKK
ncbi:MAG: efflux RND transporter periplasmic adaptor subunit [Pseudomonadota bacterium]